MPRAELPPHPIDDPSEFDARSWATLEQPICQCEVGRSAAFSSVDAQHLHDTSAFDAVIAAKPKRNGFSLHPSRTTDAMNSSRPGFGFPYAAPYLQTTRLWLKEPTDVSPRGEHARLLSVADGQLRFEIDGSVGRPAR